MAGSSAPYPLSASDITIHHHNDLYLYHQLPSTPHFHLTNPHSFRHPEIGMDDATFDKLLNPYLARPDTVVLERLLRDAAATRRTLHATHSHLSRSSHPNLSDDSDDEAEVEGGEGGHDDNDNDNDDDDDTIGLLLRLNDPSDREFAPTVFTWFNTDPHDPSALNQRLIQPYARWAAGVARRPTDAVFVTHGLIYLLTLPASAALLFWRFGWAHAVAHAVLALLSAGPFTLMLHNHIHNGGVLARNWARWDRAVPYVLQPLLGHTWDSYYFHHVKHHHVEGNGPCDLSSTLRYQRDCPMHFAQYLLRFLVLVWLELPYYFLRRRQPALAIRTFVHEAASYLTYYVLWCRNPRATAVVFLLPLLTVRVAMMVGNWAQHAFIDHRDPASDLRSSVTLIDVTVHPSLLALTRPCPDPPLTYPSQPSPALPSSRKN